jgi:hypothetical protein
VCTRLLRQAALGGPTFFTAAHFAGGRAPWSTLPASGWPRLRASSCHGACVLAGACGGDAPCLPVGYGHATHGRCIPGPGAGHPLPVAHPLVYCTYCWPRGPLGAGRRKLQLRTSSGVSDGQRAVHQFGGGRLGWPLTCAGPLVSWRAGPAPGAADVTPGCPVVRQHARATVRATRHRRAAVETGQAEHRQAQQEPLPECLYRALEYLQSSLNPRRSSHFVLNVEPIEPASPPLIPAAAMPPTWRVWPMR